MNKPLEADSALQGNPAAETFNKLRAAYSKQPLITYKERKETLKAIEKLLLENDEAICEAISADFGNRSYHETRIIEIAPAILGIRYTLKKLKKWMKPQKRHVSLLFAGGSNTIMPQAKGVVGIITPWNFPLFLALSPLTSAIAAGNRVMLKLASNSQNLAKLLKQLFSAAISEDLVAFLPGVGANDFSSLPYNHLVFTGSPAVGRTIMETASKNLTPVTLELGGKSPTILGDDFDVKTAAARIMHGKLINSGQMCVAPDYMFIPETKVDQFIEEAKAIVKQRYPEISTKDYTCVIDDRAFKRLTDTLEDARAKNAEIVNLLPGEDYIPENRKISPTIVKNVNEDMVIMQEEIFGPLLPIMTYQKSADVIEYINNHERPLALYVYSNNKKFQQEVLTNTVSGGVTVNDCAMHVAQHDMPFGGIGNSGIGHYHGYEGFVELSKMKPVFKQSKITLAIAPPYGKTFDRIYGTIRNLKWLT